jgi:hypothetical protein
MKKLRLSLFAIALTLGFSAMPSAPQIDNGKLFTAQKASASTGGPIVLDGMDPVCHSGWESTGQYIARVLKKVHDGANNPNNGRIAILGSNAVNNSCGAAWATKITEYTAEFETAPGVDFYTTDVSITSFFDSTIASAQPALIWIPDNWSRSSTTEAIFTANAEKIADFVNSGGGLFANMGSYGWLTALLPSAVYNNGGCNGGPEATADGIADFGLNNTIVEACWHGYFTGNVGTLKALVDYPYPTMSDTRKAVSIGGGSVSLPSSFTLSIAPASPRAGEDLTITATAQTIAGVAQAGVVVTVTVSSGPDAGQTLTATTDASGIATITVRTNSVGTAVYTATATVNGVAKTVSATVTWEAPVTTAPPTTTAVEELPITTTPAPTTVAPTPPEAPVAVTTVPIPLNPPTTVHDHSTHSHGPSRLPSTGINGMLIVLGFAFFLLGLATLKNKKK